VATQEEKPAERELWTGYLVAPVETAAVSNVSVGKLLASVFRGWRVWLVTGIVGGVLGVVLALSMTPIYRAAAVVAIDTQAAESLGSGLFGGQLSGLAGLAGLSLGGSNRRLEYIAVLESRALADQFIAENDLKVQFFEKQWDPKEKRWTSKKVPTADDAYRFFSEGVCRIDEDRRTGLITVSMEWRDRAAAARWANLYVQKANELLRKRAMQEASSSLEFLDRELAKASTVEIRNAMYQLVESQKKQQMLATVREDYIFHTIDPAVIADQKRFVRPKRALIVAACGIAGGLLGVAFVLFRDRRSYLANDKK
jgi:uncharacterized protein involved in exopolysaccharide biosynthesis